MLIAPDNYDEDETASNETTKPVETTKPIQTTKPTQSNTTENNTSEIRPEFKEAMDSYENFMTEYVDFMNAYAESDGTSLSFLKEYNTYMKDYVKMCKLFDEWKDEDLNDEELLYYLDVQLRVNEKLMEIND